MHPIMKIVLHFLTSGAAGVIGYILIEKATKNKNSRSVAFATALFCSLLTHILIDYKTEWF